MMSTGSGAGALPPSLYPSLSCGGRTGNSPSEASVMSDDSEASLLTDW